MTGNTGNTYLEPGIYYEEDRVVYVTDFDYNESADAAMEDQILDFETYIDPNDYDPTIPEYKSSAPIIRDDILGDYSIKDGSSEPIPEYKPTYQKPGSCSKGTKISDNMSLECATYSSTAAKLGISNRPSKEELQSIKITAMILWEPLFKMYGNKLRLNSFFRSVQLCNAIGSNSKSQHAKGQAIDVSLGSSFENIKMFNLIKNSFLFDQLILENRGQWVHVSYVSGKVNRGNYKEFVNNKLVAGTESNAKVYGSNRNNVNMA